MTAGDTSWWCRRSRAAGERGARRQSTIAEAMRASLSVADRAGVARVLRREVTLLIDSGGRVDAPTEPLQGRRAAAVALCELLRLGAASTSTISAVNGSPAIVFREAGEVIAVLALRLRRRKASEVWIVVNPDKLRHWNRP